MGITSLKLVERAMYSASVVDNAVIVCILEAHVMGAPAKCTIHPKRDLELIGSMRESFLAPISGEVGIHPTVKVPLLVGMDNETFVA